VENENYLSFKLPDDFISQYEGRDVPWGFPIGSGNSLGELTFLTKYSRRKKDETKERWFETCRRVIEGTFTIQKDWCKESRLPWNERKAQSTAQDAYERLFVGKWTPPGRGLWMMGTEFVHAKKNSAALQSCSFLSTEHISSRSVYDATWPFIRLMEMSMLGVGVGFDTKGAGKLEIHDPSSDYKVFVIPDTREGWCDSVGMLLESYFFANRSMVTFDYSEIRPSGEPIRGFGGVSAGPDPLVALHKMLNEQFAGRAGEKVSSTDIVDISNKIGKCVVSGNVRRSALISLGNSDDQDFLDLKNWEINPVRMGPNGWGHTSNNSIIANVGDDFSNIADLIAKNGEPGILWLDLCQKYGRLADPIDNKDHRARGSNPCAEQTLESGECCTLVENFISRHDSFEDFEKTLKVSYLYAKTVTLLPTHWPETNAIMQRNRRIGCSISGFAQFAEAYGWTTLRGWLDDGYDHIQMLDNKYSEWLGCRQSIKTTSVKPSGCRPWDALTVTSRGILTLQEMFKDHPEDTQWHPSGDSVVTEDGVKKVSQTYDNGKKQVMRVGMTGKMEVESTLNHQWFVTKRRARNYGENRHDDVNEWVKAEDLRVGDVLALTPGLYENTSSAPLKVVNRRHISMRSDAKEISQPSEMNSDLSWLIGYMWGDGSQSLGHWRIRFSDDDRSILENAQRIIKDNFGIEGTISKSGSSEGMDLCIASKYLWHWFILNGIFKYDLSTEELDLIPYVVRSSSREHVIAFIAGMIDAEGGFYRVGERTTVQITNSDTRLAKHMQHVSSSVGILLSRSVNKGESEGHYGAPIEHLYVWSNGSDIKSLELLKSLSVKGARFEHSNGWATQSKSKPYGEVCYMEDLGEKETFDFEVPDGHYYYNGAVKSHNTVSLLFGVTPGVHWPTADVYIRRMRLASNDPLVDALADAGYHTEPDVMDPKHSVVVELPTKGPDVRTENEVSMWEKTQLAILAQRHWADNQVSVTVTFKEDERDQIGALLSSVDGQLKSISMLPILEAGGAYAQMPYERIGIKTWEDMCSQTKKIKWKSLYAGKSLDAAGEAFCSNDSCIV